MLSIFWHALLAHLFELQLGLGRASPALQPSAARSAAPQRSHVLPIVSGPCPSHAHHTPIAHKAHPASPLHAAAGSSRCPPRWLPWCWCRCLLGMLIETVDDEAPLRLLTTPPAHHPLPAHPPYPLTTPYPAYLTLPASTIYLKGDILTTAMLTVGAAWPRPARHRRRRRAARRSARAIANSPTRSKRRFFSPAPHPPRRCAAVPLPPSHMRTLTPYHLRPPSQAYHPQTTLTGGLPQDHRRGWARGAGTPAVRQPCSPHAEGCSLQDTRATCRLDADPSIHPRPHHPHRPTDPHRSAQVARTLATNLGANRQAEFATESARAHAADTVYHKVFKLMSQVSTHSQASSK